MTVKPILAIDLDDSTWDFNPPFIEYMNGELGTNIQYNDITTFSHTDLFGVSLDEMLQHYEHFTHHLHDRVQLMPGAREGLTALTQRFDLKYLTSRCETARPYTDAHLERLGVYHLFSEGVYVNGVSQHYPARLKSAVCVDWKAVGLVDDALHNAADVSCVCGIPTALMRRRWNEGQPLPDKVYPVQNWTEIVDLFYNKLSCHTQ